MVEGDVVGVCQILQRDRPVTRSIKLGESLVNPADTFVAQIAANSSQEFIVGDLAVVVFVKVLENTLEFTGRKLLMNSQPTTFQISLKAGVNMQTIKTLPKEDI